MVDNAKKIFNSNNHLLDYEQKNLLKAIKIFLVKNY